MYKRFHVIGLQGLRPVFHYEQNFVITTAVLPVDLRTLLYSAEFHCYFVSSSVSAAAVLCAVVLFPVLYAAHLAEEGFSQPTGL